MDFYHNFILILICQAQKMCIQAFGKPGIQLVGNTLALKREFITKRNSVKFIKFRQSNTQTEIP